MVNKGQALRTPGYPHRIDTRNHPGLTDVGKDAMLFWMGCFGWDAMKERVGHVGIGYLPDGFRLWQEPQSLKALTTKPKPLQGTLW